LISIGGALQAALFVSGILRKVSDGLGGKFRPDKFHSFPGGASLSAHSGGRAPARRCLPE
jgi:hypothetical protein